MPRLLTFADVEHLLLTLRGVELILVGGQAVNFWAEYFQDEEPALRAHAPYTSQDLDFLGGAPVVRQCAQLLGSEARIQEAFAPGPSSGVIQFLDEDGDPHPIDFLHSLFGVKDTNKVIETAVPVPLVDEQGNTLTTSLRVMNPLWCLSSRVYNVVGLPGTYDNPHGLWQLKASILCARAFLARFLELGRERDVMDGVRHIYELCRSQSGLRLYARKQLDPFEESIQGLPLPAMFLEQDLPRKREKLAEKRKS